MKSLNVLVGIANLAVVIVIARSVLQLRVPAQRLFVVLISVFALRAISRALPPFGLDVPWAIAGLDMLLFIALVVLAIDARTLVQAVHDQRQRAQESQIEYDEAIQDLDRRERED